MLRPGERQFRILVVCTGNVCRSPLAERLVRTRLDAALGDGAARFVVSSAGTGALVGSPMDARAAEAASRLGADPEGSAARTLTAEMVSGADLVLTATRAHRAAAVRLHPAAHRYTFTMREFARIAAALPPGAVDPHADPVDRAVGLVAAARLHRGRTRAARPEDDDVPDPVGSSDTAFREIAAQVADALAVPLRIVTGVDFPPAEPSTQDSATATRRLGRLRRRPRPGPAGPRRRSPRRRALVTASVLLGLSLLAGGWLALRAVQTAHALAAARADVQHLRSALFAGDERAARRAVTAAQRHARRAARLTAGPAWRVAAAPPYLGNTARTVRAVAEALSDLSATALPALADAGAELRPDRVWPSGDRIALDRIVRSGPSVAATLAGVRAASARLRGVDLSWVPASVQGAARQVRRDLDRASGALDAVRGALRLAPRMLGSDGPRRYFVAFQNSAEARGTGGLVGMYAVVSFDHGRLRVERLGSNTDLVNARDLPVDLGADFRQRWGDDPALWANSNMDPSFPYAARLWLALWQRQTGQRLDGAVATDPVALGYVLRATGPVRLRGGDSIGADNAVWLTLSGVYARYPGRDSVRNAYMRQVAQAVLDVLMSGRADPVRLAGALSQAAGERRLLVYSGHPDEEQELAPTSVGGRLPAGAGPYAFVVVNNAAGNKMDYYLTRSVRYTSTGCAEGTRESRIDVTVGNSAPPADRLPRYVTQRLDRGSTRVRSAAPGSVAVLASVYGARGAQVEGATLDGRPLPVSAGVEDGRPVWGFPLVVPPGGRRTVVLYVVEPASDAAPVVPVQPLAQPQHTEISLAPCD